jgi:hypothetical protein
MDEAHGCELGRLRPPSYASTLEWPVVAVWWSVVLGVHGRLMCGQSERPYAQPWSELSTSSLGAKCVRAGCNESTWLGNDLRD